MCFFVHPKHAEEKTAKKDIKCWKLVDKDYSNFHPRVTHIRTIYDKLKTYHAHNRNKIVKKLVINKNWCEGGAIYEGIHSFSTFKIADFFLKMNNGRIISCIIPKGTKYYYNPDFKEYVSLKVKRIK